MFEFLQGLSFMTWAIIATSVVGVFIVQAVFLSAKLRWFFKYPLALFVPQLLIGGFFHFFLSYSLTIHLIVAVPAIGLHLLVVLLTYGSIPKKQKITDPIYSVPIALKSGYDLIIQNIKRGVAIFGSAGSGKTEFIVHIIKHAAAKNIPVLCYDLKDGELTEIANYFYGDTSIPVKVIVPHDPSTSFRVNPLHPKYIKNEQFLRQATKTIFNNLKKSESSKSSGGNSFFDKIPECTLAAVIWRLKEDFPEFCTLPHAVALCLEFSPVEIAEFIKKNQYAKAIGTPLIDSLTSENQIAGVKASLSLPLTDLAIPSIFWVLSGNEVDLDINNPANPCFLSVVNNPQLKKSNAPFISLIISTAINMMQARNRPASILLLDEGTTFGIDDVSAIPATMRSYNISTVFATQDIALAKENWGDAVTKSFFANLSYQIVGKTNDPDSVKYYKQISEEIEKTTISKSYKDSLMGGDNRISESKKDTSKFKNQDFTRLQAGQFFVFADGHENMYNIKQVPYTRVQPKVRNHITNSELQEHFLKIFEDVKGLE